MVAVLWGGNIGAIYPFLQVALNRQSLQEWVAGEIQQSDQKIQTLEKSLAAWKKRPRRPARRVHRRRNQVQHGPAAIVGRTEGRQVLPLLAAVYRALSAPRSVRDAGADHRREPAGHGLEERVPDRHTILVARLSELTTFELRKRFYRRTLRMDLATFHNEGTSDLMSRFTHDTDNVAAG